MGPIESSLPRAASDLFKLVDEIPAFGSRRGINLFQQREACAAVLAAADDDLIRVQRMLTSAYAQYRADDRQKSCANILGRTIDRVRSETWAQRRGTEHESALDEKPQGLKARLELRYEWLASAIYRNIPGTYGWELARSLTAKSATTQSIADSLSCEWSLSDEALRNFAGSDLVPKFLESDEDASEHALLSSSD